jgi:crotonobetainyl-CoA:carnitine CoA-transferase CaiB-like acyl-CoA transferase
MYAFSSILAALIRRGKTGEGASLDITMFEALGEWMGFPAYFTAYGGSAPARSGAYHATIVPYGPFYAGDGGTVFLSVQNEREFARFCDSVLGNAGLAADPRFSSGPARLQHREALHAEIDRVFSRLTAAQVVERLEAADIANARLNTLEEFWRHPQLEARRRWATVGSPAGDLAMLKPPFNLEGVDARMDPIPGVGEHTTRILGELGFTSSEVERLRREGAV